MQAAENADVVIDTGAPGMPIQVQIFRRAADLNQIEQVWKRWQQHPNCDYEYFCSNLRTLPGVQSPHVLVAFSGGVPRAMLIGRLEKGKQDFALGYKRIFSVPVKRLTVLHGGWVGETSPAVSAAMLNALQGALDGGDADIVYFNHLRLDDPLYQEMKRSLDPGQVTFGENRRHRGMTLVASGAGFKALLTSKERNNQKRRERRMLEDFKEKVRLETYRFPSELDAMIRDIDVIAKRTYQRALKVGFEDTPSMRERLQIEAERGWLRAYVLYLDESPCAFWMGDVYAGIFYSGFTGYDSVYSKYAPGMFLLLKAMELLCEENRDGTIKAANFGLGDAEWKQIIGDLEWQEAAVFVYAASAKGRLLARMQGGSSLVNRLGKRILDRGRSVAKLKRFWRSRLSRTPH